MFNGVKSLKEFCHGKGLRLSLIAVILGIMVLAPMVSAAKNPNPGVLPVDSTPFGKTYADWSEEWWKWIQSIPASNNPLLDETGEFCDVGQSGKVWFLTGTWGKTEVTRECEVPAGKAIFFPIINGEGSTIEGNGETEEELRGVANFYMDSVTLMKVIVDGKQLKNLDGYRVESSLFEFEIPEDSVLEEFDLIVPEYEGARASNSVSDGYWIMMEPLSKGKHVIYIYGMAEFPDGSTFETEVTYNLEVV